jgi:hypothetical protein
MRTGRRDGKPPYETTFSIPVSAPMVALVALSLLAVLCLALVGWSSAGPPETIQCTECHDEFVPFKYTIEAPTEVPVGEPFDLVVTVSNDEMHAVYSPTVMLSVVEPGGIVVETGEPAVAQFHEQGTLAFRGSLSFSIPVNPGAQTATFDLDGSGGLLDNLDIQVSGADGGSWAASGGGVDESITLNAADLAEGGYGTYQVTVSHPAGVRRVTFALRVEVGYGLDVTMLTGPDLQQGDSHAFSFTLRGMVEGDNGVQVVVSGTAVHNHQSGEMDETDFSEDETVPIEVGDELVYGGQSGNGDGGGSLDDVLSGGRYLGVLAATLLGVSIVSSGHLRWFPRRSKVHCWSSYAMVATFVVHWTMLWAGPYGSTLGGIGTGSVLLVCIVLLAITGARPALLDGRVMGLPSRRLHRNLTYGVVVVLVVHAVANGSDLAFIRDAFA